MKSPEDRRALNVPRVSLTTLVDICSQTGDASPFQAESANVSGRGMNVRTSYLPEVGEELVCRLNHHDQEVLVEGRVAWRSEGQDSGEFGIQFTALDADSADVLQALGAPLSAPGRRASVSTPSFEEEMDEETRFVEGSRVKLHIEGLGAPMKACVHAGTARKLRVGSCLEFLKVGRELQVEDLAGGGQRSAHVDSVNVVINPTTSIPELVVQLRYEGVSPTPAPVQAKDKSAVDYDDDAFSTYDAEEDDDGISASAPELSDDDAAPWEPAAEALRARLGLAVASAGQAAQKAGGMLGTVAKSARDSMAAVAARRKSPGAPHLLQTRPQTPHTKRRQTSRRTSQASPAHLRSGIHDLGLAGKSRPVSSRRSQVAAPVAPPKRNLPRAVLFGAAFLVLGGSAFAIRTLGAEEPPAAPVVAAQPEAKAATSVASAPASPPQIVATKPQVPEGEMAEVPLFGPQAMAVKPAEKAPDPEIDVGEAEKRAAAASIEDQSWGASGEEDTKEVTPWGRGRLYLPTIHRIRLDGEGASLSGTVNADGFTVVIPGRKAMESGKPIQKRDRRISTVEASNGARGATMKFEFRGSVPAYRVRLRKDFVEFLISSPEDTVARL